MYDIAIIGGGFSGAMLVAQLAQRDPSLSIALIDPSPDLPRGAAYSTRHEEHLLNVPAGRMGAFADDIEGFHRWCLAHTSYQSPGDFVPRRIYGDYLSEVFDEAAAIVRPDIITQRVTHIESGALHTLTLADGRTLQAKRLALATGNPFPASHAGLICEPWRFDFASLANKDFKEPIVIIGTGLTAVDTLMSLRKHQVRADILFISRHGHFPAAHTRDTKSLVLSITMFEGQPLSTMMYRLRRVAREAMDAGHSWPLVMDAMRPHTVALWRSLSTRDRIRFLKRLRHYWDIHRHRMAGSIHAQLQEALTHGQARVLKGRATAEGTSVTVQTSGGEQRIKAAMVFDCTGPRHRVEQQPMLAALLAGGTLEASPVGLGLRSFSPYRVSRDGLAPIYAIGPLLIGERLESTAVPELRQQAAAIAALVAP